jgi:hypothetical protein
MAVTGMDDAARSRQTAQVLRLLDESFRAHACGDKQAADAAAQEACRLDVDCVSVIQGGIYIGEIPNPEADYPAWAEYVQAAQERAHDDEAAK